MSKNVSEIPFTEMVEIVQKLARVSADTRPKIRGVINEIYTREIPAKFDWNFLIVSSSITTIPEYKTGTVSINTDASAADFSSDVSLTQDFVGRKIKFSGNDAVYEISSVGGATSASILPPLTGGANLTSVSYSVFQPVYALASDFDRFPKDGGIYKWVGGKKQVIQEESYQESREDYSSSPGTPSNVRLVGINSAGQQLIELRPAPSDSRVYGYDYLRRLPPLFETTAGFILGLSANATLVTGQTTTRFLEASTSIHKKWQDYFLRVNPLGTAEDSSWYQALNISTNSLMTLNVTFANTAITSSAAYVISKSPEIPKELHPAILYGALRALTLDQTDPNAAYYNTKMAETLSDAKRIFVSRRYSQDISLIAEEYHYRR